MLSRAPSSIGPANKKGQLEPQPLDHADRPVLGFGTAARSPGAAPTRLGCGSRSAAVSTLFRFCPPGPDRRVIRISHCLARAGGSRAAGWSAPAAGSPVRSELFMRAATRSVCVCVTSVSLYFRSAHSLPSRLRRPRRQAERLLPIVSLSTSTSRLTPVKASTGGSSLAPLGAGRYLGSRLWCIAAGVRRARSFSRPAPPGSLIDAPGRLAGSIGRCAAWLGRPGSG